MKKLKEFEIELTEKESGYKKTVLVKKFRHPSGVIENFFVDKEKPSVQIFAISPDQNTVYTVSQWRSGVEKPQLELPGGGINQGEDPMTAAHRELKEETGCEASEMVLLASMRTEMSPVTILCICTIL